MKVAYWIAPCLNDNPVYSLRAKTKKEVVAMLASGQWEPKGYGPVEKVVIEYNDAFDLVKQLVGCEGNYGAF